MIDVFLERSFERPLETEFVMAVTLAAWVLGYAPPPDRLFSAPDFSSAFLKLDVIGALQLAHDSATPRDELARRVQRLERLDCGPDGGQRRT